MVPKFQEHCFNISRDIVYMGTVSVPSSTPVSFQGLQMGIFVFWTERDWSRKSCYGNTIEGVILKVSSRRCAILIVSASRKLMLEYPNSSQLTERYEQQPHAVNYRTEDAR